MDQISNVFFFLKRIACICVLSFFSDSKDFHDIASNPENLQFIFPSQASPEESQYALANYFMKAPLGVWAICDKKTEKMIGSIKFEKLDEIKKRSRTWLFF